MRRIPCPAAAIGLPTFALVLIALAPISRAQGRPLSVPKFAGSFVWLKVGSLPARTMRSLGSASSIVFDLSFPHEVILKKDSRGYQWFTFVIADQGHDSKWHQTSRSGGVAAPNGVIKAGKVTVTVPLEGIPRSVLEEKMQTFSLGPNTSGLVKPISFSVDNWRTQ